MGDKVFPLHALWEKGLSKKCTIGEKVILWNVLWEKRYFGRKGLFNTYINGEKGFQWHALLEKLSVSDIVSYGTKGISTYWIFYNTKSLLHVSIYQNKIPNSEIIVTA